LFNERIGDIGFGRRNEVETLPFSAEPKEVFLYMVSFKWNQSEFNIGHGKKLYSVCMFERIGNER